MLEDKRELDPEPRRPAGTPCKGINNGALRAKAFAFEVLKTDGKSHERFDSLNMGACRTTPKMAMLLVAGHLALAGNRPR